VRSLANDPFYPNITKKLIAAQHEHDDEFYGFVWIYFSSARDRFLTGARGHSPFSRGHAAMALPPEYNPSFSMHDDPVRGVTTGTFTVYSDPVLGTYMGNGVWMGGRRLVDPRDIRILDSGTIMSGTERVGTTVDAMTPEQREAHAKRLEEVDARLRQPVKEPD